MAIIGKYLFWIAVIYIALVVALYMNQRNMMYFPNRHKPDIRDAGVKGMEEIAVTTEDGLNITGWYKAPDDVDKPVIIWFHGNAQHHAYRVVAVVEWMKQGYGVLLAGYRGYAGNPGKPAEQGLYADARAYVQAVKDAGHDIVLYGESLGSGVAVETAVGDPDVKALIIEAPYTSTVNVAREKYPFVPVGLLMKDRYESINKIANFDRPLLIMHGENDTLIPPGHGKAMHEAAKSEQKTLKIFPGAGHSNLHLSGSVPAVLEFLSTLE